MFGFKSRRPTSNSPQLTSDSAAEPPTVNVISAEPSDASQSLTLPGETAAWDETTIYARVNGYVAKWLVDIGDHVTAGQSLAAIETPELDAELLASRAKLNAAVAEVAVKQAEADFAETTERRWRESPKGVVSDQEREAKSAGKAEAIANLNESRAQVALQQAEVDRLSALTQFKDVKAPFEGTIVQRNIDIGNLVTAGSTANTSSLYRLSSDNPIRIFVHVPQNVASQIIADGADVEITSGDDPGLRLEGQVKRTAKSIDPASRTMRNSKSIFRMQIARAGAGHVRTVPHSSSKAPSVSRFPRPPCCFARPALKSRWSTKTA